MGLRYKSRLGFTFIEILVSISIIAILVAISTSGLSNIQGKSRDGKRKTDLGQIQVAIESYRDGSTASTYPADIPEQCAGTGGITAGSNTYLATVPHDPKCNTLSYYYYPFSNNTASCTTYMGVPAPCACNGTTVLCDDYTLGVRLERETGSVCAGNPGSNLCVGGDCNYCVGPYGKK